MADFRINCRKCRRSSSGRRRKKEGGPLPYLMRARRGRAAREAGFLLLLPIFGRQLISLLPDMWEKLNAISYGFCSKEKGEKEGGGAES